MARHGATNQIPAELDLIREASEPVLSHGIYILGPEVAVLEGQLAGRLGTRYAIGCNSGFGAHLLSLLTLEVGVDSSVLVSPFSPPSFAGVVIRRNAHLLLADVSPLDFHMSPAAAGAQIADADVIVVHHLFGGTADMPAICAAANDKAIIEVTTYSFDAQVQGGSNVGTYGTLATSCLREYTALGAYGDAGMIWTNESDLAERVRQIRREGEHTDVYTGITAGNFHMDTIHASILLRKLESRREELARRQELTRALADAIASVGVDGIIVPDWYDNTASRFVMLAPQRDQLCEHLGRYGIQAEPWWPVPIHLQPGFRKLGYSRGDFPNAEYIADHSIHISLGGDTAAPQRIVEALARFYT